MMVNLSMIDQLPELLFATILTEWLAELKSLAALDTACCNRKERDLFLCALQATRHMRHPIEFQTKSLIKYRRLSNWLAQRSLAIAHMEIKIEDEIQNEWFVPDAASNGFSPLHALTIRHENIERKKSLSLDNILILFPNLREFTYIDPAHCSVFSFIPSSILSKSCTLRSLRLWGIREMQKPSNWTSELLRLCPHITDFSLNECSSILQEEFLILLQGWSKQLSSITYISNTRLSHPPQEELLDQLLPNEAQDFPALTKLVLKAKYGASRIYRVLFTKKENLSLLREFELGITFGSRFGTPTHSINEWLTFVDAWAGLKCLKLYLWYQSNDRMAQFTRAVVDNCRRLETFEYQSYYMEDEDAVALSTALPHLHTLRLGELSNLTKVGITALCTALCTASLQSLEISIPPGEPERFLAYTGRLLHSFQQLKKLIIHNAHDVNVYAFVEMFLSSKNTSAGCLEEIVYIGNHMDYELACQVCDDNPQIWSRAASTAFAFAFPRLRVLQLYDFPLNSELLQHWLCTSPLLTTLHICYSFVPPDVYDFYHAIPLFQAVNFAVCPLRDMTIRNLPIDFPSFDKILQDGHSLQSLHLEGGTKQVDREEVIGALRRKHLWKKTIHS